MTSTLRTTLVTTAIALAAGLAAGTAGAVIAPQWLKSETAKVCRLDPNTLLNRSLVGASATKQLQALHDKLQSVVDHERQAIQADGKQLDSAPPADAARGRPAVNARWATLQQKAAQESQQLNALRNAIVQKITLAERPVIADAGRAEGCGVTVGFGAILDAGNSTDLTDRVVAGMDKAIPVISIQDLVRPSASAPASGDIK